MRPHIVRVPAVCVRFASDLDAGGPARGRLLHGELKFPRQLRKSSEPHFPKSYHRWTQRAPELSQSCAAGVSAQLRPLLARVGNDLGELDQHLSKAVSRIREATEASRHDITVSAAEADAIARAERVARRPSVIGTFATLRRAFAHVHCGAWWGWTPPGRFGGEVASEARGVRACARRGPAMPWASLPPRTPMAVGFRSHRCFTPCLCPGSTASSTSMLAEDAETTSTASSTASSPHFQPVRLCRRIVAGTRPPLSPSQGIPHAAQRAVVGESTQCISIHEWTASRADYVALCASRACSQPLVCTGTASPRFHGIPVPTLTRGMRAQRICACCVRILLIFPQPWCPNPQGSRVAGLIPPK